MTPPDRLRRLFRLATFTRSPEHEVDEELRFHLESRVADLMAAGHTRDAAEREAAREFGDVGAARAELARIDRGRLQRAERTDWWLGWMQDVRFGVRSALRAPLFSLLAILTLALGIGANAAIFGVVKSVLIDALPYADADRLVRVYGRHLDDPTDRQGISAGAVADLAARQRSFASLAAFYHNTFDNTVTGTDGARLLSGAQVGGTFFQTLGVPALVGRTLTSTDAAPDAAPVVVLSHDAWQREFAGARAVVGTSLRVDGDPHEVVGVLPRGFVGPMGDADLWFPLDMAPALRDPKSARGQHWLGVVARLHPGVPLTTAERELAAIAVDMAREHPDSDGGRSTATLSLRDAMVGDMRKPLLVLMASAGLVLLITCANLAGALLSRTIARRKEFAVRAAIGAGRGRLVRQLLTESTLLAAAGGAAGLLLATLGLTVLGGLALPALPPYAELALDRGAVLVGSVLALVTGLVFGLAPAMSVARSDAQGTLRDETRGSSESRRSRQLRGMLVAGQIALCVSLLTGAGLLGRSLWAMTSSPLGFKPDRVLTVGVTLPVGDYPTVADRARLFERLEERLRGLPGVRGVGSASELPTPGMNRNALVIEGVPLPAGDGQTFIAYASVSDDYFSTMGIALRRGRTFTTTDQMDAPPAIVISESMARRYWPPGGALGARIRISPHTSERWGEVVGIVGDVRNDPAQADPAPMAYASNRQDAARTSRVFLLRTDGDPLALARPFRRELATLDPTLPVRDATPLRAVLAEGLSGRRLPVVLMTAFGALALLLASVGVYAMFASMAAAREREFGVRVALGSTRGAIAALVLRQGGSWMALGLVGGAAGVVFVARALKGLLYGIAPFDAITLVAASLTLVACAVLALLGPVRRATRADPISALR